MTFLDDIFFKFRSAKPTFISLMKP